MSCSGRTASDRCRRVTGLSLLLVAVLGSGCGRGSTPHGAPLTRSPSPLAASLERALRRNPNQEASFARCRTATPTEQRAAPFGPTRRPVLRCSIAIAVPAGPPSDYDVQVLGNGCYVGSEVDGHRGDLGCGALRVAALG